MTASETPHNFFLPGRILNSVAGMFNRQNAQGIGGARSVLCVKRKEWSDAEPRKARSPHRGDAPNINSTFSSPTPNSSLTPPSKKEHPHV
jgi:hypothetical protein